MALKMHVNKNNDGGGSYKVEHFLPKHILSFM